MACDFCSETNFCLGDNPDFGPCVCCTPAKMEAMAETIRGADEEREAMAETIRCADEEREAWDVERAEGSKNIADNQRERDDALEVLGQAWEHFAAYLTRLGLDPRAVKLQDPDLDALMALLGD